MAADATQLERLREQLAVLCERNTFYRRRLGRDFAVRHQTSSLSEILEEIPLLTKDELVEDQRQNAPYGSNLTFPVDHYVRLHQTSGTSGRPLSWLDTAESWQWFLDGWADVFRAANIGAGDRAFFAFSFGPFIGFWAAFEACRQLGVLALSGGGLTTEQRLDVLLDHDATVLVCTPTYALRLAEAARDRGVDLAQSALRITLHAGEPGASLPAVRERLEAAYGARCHDHAGATEIGPWGLPGEDGFMGVNGQGFVAELLDPETEQLLIPQPGGTRGELVLTNLGRHGSPVLRYRTGDLVDMWPAESADGNLRLAGGVLARADDMVVVRGVNVYPSALESIVRDFEAQSPATVDEYRVDVHRRDEMIELKMTVEISGAPAEATAAGLSELLRHRLKLRVPIEIAESGSLPRFELKAKRFHRHDV
ncbi:MAG: phenylacetate--CoA ligase family protein [Acidobacteriota bacterium]